MKKMLKYLSLLILTLAVVSCGPELEMKYQENPQPVECPGADKALLHEALYSFQEDIAKAYNYKRFDPKEPLYIVNGYRYFVHKGGLGEADFAELMSSHTKAVLQELRKEPIWSDVEGYSNLDYQSEFVVCVLDNIKNRDMQETFASLNEINSMSPKLTAEPLRRNVNQVANDPYLAMYIALDYYYNYLLDLESE
ncbi:hypothetical protein BST85_07085 [Aureitalea marina]|uniref:Uncharacterized protein n=2 Tax=Aureitalea marina TaxID=930804 RepID=A0A2S7KPY5_9FLAO|nr:hypothetical protein BST85_07085 [Aureitalea marina]